MMPSVDHCVNNTSEMTSLSKTLEVFDTYKHREDKDSDEESFHLPLDDDDLDPKVSEPGKNFDPNETEDEILNKFDNVAAVAGENIDVHLEEHLLNDDEEVEKSIKNNTTELTDHSLSFQTNSKISEERCRQNMQVTDNKESVDIDVNKEGVILKKNSEDDVNFENEKVLEESKNILTSTNSIKSDTEKIKLFDKDKDTGTKEIDCNLESNETISTANMNMCDDSKRKNQLINCETENKETDIFKLAANADESCPTSIDSVTEERNEILIEKSEDVKNMNGDIRIKGSTKMDTEDIIQSIENENCGDQRKVDKCDNSNDALKHNEDTEDLFDISIIRDAEEDNAESAYNEANQDEEADEEDDRGDEKIEEDLGNGKSSNEEDEEGTESDNKEEHLKNDDVKNMNGAIRIKGSIVNDEQSDHESTKMDTEDIIQSIENENCGDQEKVDKCDNSNDALKHNEDTEDLFDISIIRDAEEDNAESAYNEANQVQEADEEDDRGDEKIEEDLGNGKSSNEEDEEGTESDNKEEHLKNDDVDVEETNLDCDSTRELVGNTECEDDTIKSNLEGEKTLEKETDEANRSVKECMLDEVTGNLVKTDSSQIIQENGLDDRPNNEANDSENSATRKRQLTDDEEESATTKKVRLVDELNESIKEVEKPKEAEPLKTLLSLPMFMKSKKNSKRLTMHDLEEFCIQKICEVIVHKSELGDVYHQLKVQEQMIETMRKEIQQLTKQSRDLEIVNKRLINDLKQQNATQKPLHPLRITRSVGLQVKFTPTLEFNVKRRPMSSGPLPPKNQPQQAVHKNPRIPTNTTPAAAQRQVTANHKQLQQSSKSTPLLSQALQTRRNGVNETNLKNQPQNARPKTTDPKNGATASVIDLTDEDDKKDKNRSQTKVVTTKSVTLPLRTTPVRVNAGPQGIRLTTSQGKVTPITTMVNSSTPQLMYVVQSGGQNVLASSLGPKAVVVNFQSANGVLTSPINGSPVSVIPKQGNTIQLKTLPNNKIVKLPSKHPAPLPSPPVIRVVTDRNLKPIPPKPHLTIRKTDTGIILQWKMPYELDMYENIASYQLYAYQETSAMPSTDMWRKVGDVKALALPMACTLTQFADKNKYYFAVRPVDIHKRIGMFSDPEEISL